jgi:acyl-CoA thioester hydrolase
LSIKPTMLPSGSLSVTSRPGGNVEGRLVEAEALASAPSGPYGTLPRGMPIDTPLDMYRDVVRPEWIDSNRHMNMGYYVVVFDLATDEFMRWVGLDAEHRRLHRITTFCLEAHVTYHREVREGDPLRFTTQLLAHDAKRLHYIHAMYHAIDGYLAATNELMSLHVALETRRGATMAPAILARLAEIRAAHDALARPPQVGRVMGLAARPATR